MLLARLSPSLVDAGRWTLPGGGLDWGEDPADGVVREIREETGLAATVAGVAGVFSHVFDTSDGRREPMHFVSIVYWATVAGGALVHERDGSTDLAAWVPLTDVAALPLVPLATYGLGLLAGEVA
jgi:ADP-ribose pyrophosphatase YjhB (NUDIX family)